MQFEQVEVERPIDARHHAHFAAAAQGFVVGAGNVHAVAAGILGGKTRRIGLGQGHCRAAGLVGDQRQADARGQAVLQPVPLKTEGARRVKNVTHRPLCIARLTMRHQDAELVAAEPGKHVSGAE